MNLKVKMVGLSLKELLKKTEKIPKKITKKEKKKSQKNLLKRKPYSTTF